MHSSTTIEKSPLLPGILSIPFKLVPPKVHSRLLVAFLNQFLSQQITDGELDFLQQKTLCINVCDAGIYYYISLQNNRLVSVASSNKSDIEIHASVYDFLQLAARQQDPDALVFQRRLVLQGNTELGLELKNFLDGVDLESKKIAKIEQLLLKVLPVYRRLFS